MKGFMNKSQFPSMLKNKATLLGYLTRFDLMILGCAYLILSALKVSGLWALVINAALLLFVKFIKTQYPKGFLRFLTGERQLSWAYKLGDLRNE